MQISSIARIETGVRLKHINISSVHQFQAQVSSSSNLLSPTLQQSNLWIPIQCQVSLFKFVKSQILFCLPALEILNRSNLEIQHLTISSTSLPPLLLLSVLLTSTRPRLPSEDPRSASSGDVSPEHTETLELSAPNSERTFLQRLSVLQSESCFTQATVSRCSNLRKRTGSGKDKKIEGRWCGDWRNDGRHWRGRSRNTFASFPFYQACQLYLHFDRSLISILISSQLLHSMISV